jgi:hypothetical protein
MAEGRVVKVQKAPTGRGSAPAKFDSLEVLTELCYLYPRYSLHEARRLPYFHVCRLLRQARKQRARHYLHLTQIVAAPHTKGGDLYKQLVDQFEKEANG